MLPQKEMDAIIREDQVHTLFLQQTTDYAAILEAYGLAYMASGHYLQVGEITQVQGWILHLSVISMQVPDLFEVIIPVLKAAAIPFKIPVNKDTCDGLLTGACGYNNLAKVVCIYADNDSKALEFAQKLILLTASFKGPDIPTDLHLGAVVYTRYGSFNPVWQLGADGNIHKYIYDRQGNLVEDTYPIPFAFPTGINWPFAEITSSNLPPRKKIMNDRIRPLSVIKPDVKGNVIKGQYMKGWFQVKHCVVKEGKRCMFMDEWGRDIQDRLEWQMKLHNDLCEEVPVPKILDCFWENGDLYLAMEFIDGISVDDKIFAIYEGRSWIDLAPDKCLLLLEYLLSIIHIIQGLHKKGYVHRDISPYNFLIDPKNRMHVIDLELVYSTTRQTPSPSFKGGTEGFMAPEQIDNNIPTVKEDIYGLGALMILFFTNLSPLKFETAPLSVLKKNLQFFIQESSIVELIINCLHPDAECRPGLPVIQEAIYQYRNRLLQSVSHSHLPGKVAILESWLTAAIHKSLRGISSELMMYNNLWFSKTTQQQPAIANQQNSCSLYPGVYEGMSGVLFMLSLLENSSFVMEAPVKAYYQHNIAYIKQTYLPNLRNLPGGLYTGSAGIAVTLAAGIQAKLLEDTAEHLSAIHTCLEQESPDMDLVNGAAGQGVAVLQCIPYLPDYFVQTRLQQLGNLLLTNQQQDGSWIMLTPGSQKEIKITGLACGSSGIIWFLLKLAAMCKAEPAAYAAVKALHWLQKQAYKSGNAYLWPINSRNRQADPSVYSGGAGIALTFIKAYELLQDPAYKSMAEGALNSYPPHVSTRDLSQAWGLAGLGEVYLEAWRVLKNEMWKERADGVANILLNLQKCREDDVCYWLTDALCSLPTADFMTGNSGIIHFLARYLLPEKLHYPLL